MGKIPKIIHYCWVGGGPKPESVLRCIESWKRCCPDYEIREWNETNYDFTKNEYMRQAYEAGKWGFVPDYARLDILFNQGGIYLDTDVELLRSFDDLLDNESFFGFEDTGMGDYYIACGLGFGAAPNNPLIQTLRDSYDGLSFYQTDGGPNLLPAPRQNAPVFISYGFSMNNELQTVKGNTVFPSEYFCPKVFSTGKTILTPNTRSIHHFSASWMEESIRREMTHNQTVRRKLGDRLGNIYLYFESVWSKYGFIGTIKQCLVRIYEVIYLYWPIISASFPAQKTEKQAGILLFDTSLYSENTGDQIIVESCKRHLREKLDLSQAVSVSTHRIPDPGISPAGAHKILCGTNILSGHMGRYGLWKLPRNLESFRGTLLMGVGFASDDPGSDHYSRLLLRCLLSKNRIHSVRDTFSEKMLKSMGIQNVLYTGCPTMWDLTPRHCATIPTHKAKHVVCTLTDYNRDSINDRAMLEILLKHYETVYFWPQGSMDLKYLRSLGYEDKLMILPPSLESYDSLLTRQDLDYVGTRLHAGIHALAKGHRSLIISIDNRAKCISADTGLPTLDRSRIPCDLCERIHQPIETKLLLPWDNIQKWKEQF